MTGVPVQTTQLIITAEGTKPGSEDAHNAILADLRNIAAAINANQPGITQPGSYGGGPTASAPTAGLAKVFATPNVNIAVSSSNYYTITGMVNGNVQASFISTSTKTVPVVAYQPIYLGTAKVSKSSMVEVSITPTGSPSGLTTANFSVRIDLSPQAPS